MQKIILNKEDTFKIIFKLCAICLFCFITAAFFTCIFAAVISKTDFAYDILPVITAAILALSAFFDGYVISKLSKENGLILGVLVGVILVAVLIVVSFKYSLFNISVTLCTKAAISIASGAIGGIIGVNTN